MAAARSALARGDVVACAIHAQQALQTDSLSTPQRIVAYSLLSQARFRRSEGTAAVRAGHQALALFEAGTELSLQAFARTTLAMAYSGVGLYCEGLAEAAMALDAARAAGDRRAEYWALNRLAVCHAHLGDFDASFGCSDSALAIARTLQGGDEELFAILHNQALDRMEQAARLAGSERREALAEGWLLIGEALTFARRNGPPMYVALALKTLSHFLRERGEHDAALAAAEEAERLARQHEAQAVAHSAALVHAAALQARGDAAAAIDKYESALLAGLCPNLRGNAHRALHMLHKNAGNPARALEHHEQWAALETERLRQRADAQTRALSNRLQLEQARLDAERQRLRAIELEERAARLDRDARQDALTGLANRRAFDETLPRLLERAGHGRQPLALAIADLDRFKRINDTHGHPLGDQVLRELGELLRVGIRANDLVARLGGEEFALVLTGTATEMALDVCERLRLAVAAHPWQRLARGLGVTISIGLAARGSSSDAGLLVKRADAALYRAKHAGRNRVELA